MLFVVCLVLFVVGCVLFGVCVVCLLFVDWCVVAGVCCLLYGCDVLLAVCVVFVCWLLLCA